MCTTPFNLLQLQGYALFEVFCSSISLTLAMVNTTIFHLPQMISKHFWKNLIDHVVEKWGCLKPHSPLGMPLLGQRNLDAIMVVI